MQIARPRGRDRMTEAIEIPGVFSARSRYARWAID
jgi:hypothetical protein